ncbi:MAG: PTS transporter subunit EIIC [Clostridiaceae bacterium]|nr:PTS transporter subunit EIIC [Clostridiaceae bacterium]
MPVTADKICDEWGDGKVTMRLPIGFSAKLPMSRLHSRTAEMTDRLRLFLLLPVSVLPLAGLFLALGDSLGRWSWPFASVWVQVGTVLLEQFPLLAAIAIAAGLAAEKPVLAAFSAAAAYLAVNRTGITVVEWLAAGKNWQISFNFGLLTSLAVGFLAAGICQIGSRRTITGWRRFLMNPYLAPALSVLIALVIGFIGGFVWYGLQTLLLRLAGWIPDGGAGGLFIYGFLNRLLMPLGLHRGMNQTLWFQYGQYTTQNGLLVEGDLARFLAGDPTAGRITAGFFPVMLMVIPAVAASIWSAGRKEKKNRLYLFLAAAAMASLWGGITEPVEYLILLISPVLYVFYSLLCGLSMLLCAQLRILQGFSFSAGLNDYLYNWTQATRPGWILVVGLVLAVLAFVIFYFFIRRFHCSVPDFPGIPGLFELSADSEKTAPVAAEPEDQAGHDS